MRKKLKKYLICKNNNKLIYFQIEIPRIVKVAKDILSKSKIVKHTIVPKSQQPKIQPVAQVQPVQPVQPVYVQVAKPSIGGAIVDGISSGFGWGIGTSFARSIFGGSNVNSESNVTQGNSHVQTHTDKIEANNSYSSVGSTESVKNTDSELYSYETPSNDSYETSSNDSWDDSE